MAKADRYAMLEQWARNMRVRAAGGAFEERYANPVYAAECLLEVFWSLTPGELRGRAQETANEDFKRMWNDLATLREAYAGVQP